jgi:Sec-independent protein translocase protein TatA
MPWSFIVPAALSVFGANKQASAAKDAAASTAAATNEATQLQREMFQQQRQDQMPWLKAGEQALNKLIPMTDYQKFGMDQFQQDPGYAFRLSEGRKALAHQAAARGGAVSGQSLKAMQDYAQGSASNEYTNAFNRYQTERNAALNPLQSLAGVGQTTANQLGAAGQNYASNVGNALINQGANAGNARMAAASAYGSALSGIGSAYGRNPVSFGSLYGGGGGYSGAGQVNPVSGEYMGSLEF